MVRFGCEKSVSVRQNLLVLIVCLALWRHKIVPVPLLMPALSFPLLLTTSKSLTTCPPTDVQALPSCPLDIVVCQ